MSNEVFYSFSSWSWQWLHQEHVFGDKCKIELIEYKVDETNRGYSEEVISGVVRIAGRRVDQRNRWKK